MAQPSSAEVVRRRLTTAWLADARTDLANARTLSTHRDEATSPSAAAFHAQQAVEKGAKSLLVWLGLEYPPKHDLGLLVGLLPTGLAIKSLAVAGLTVYAVEQRDVVGVADPMELIERPSWEEADEAIALADEAVTAIEGDLAASWSGGE